MKTIRYRKSLCGTVIMRSSLSLVLALSMIVGGKVVAASGTWTGGSSSGANFSDTTNWSGGTVPGSSSSGTVTNADTATFSSNVANGTSTPIVIDTYRNLKTIAFDTAAGSYTIGSTSGNALYLTSAGAIQIMSTITGTGLTETVNAPLILEGAYTISNASTDATNVLHVGGAISGGVSSAITLTLAGANTGDNIISGNISNGASTSLGVTKSTSGGKWILSGNNSYTGVTSIVAGTLVLSGDNSAMSGGISIAGNGAILGIGSATALGSGSLALGNAATIDNVSGGSLAVTTNNVISLAGSFTFTGTNNLNMGTGAISANASKNFTATINGSTLTFGGAMTGGVQTYLVKAGVGTLVLAGDISYGGATTIGTSAGANSGTLVLSGNNTSMTGGVTVFNGVLDINSATALGTGLLTLANGWASIDNTSGTSLVLTTNNSLNLSSFTFLGTNNLDLGSGAVTVAAAMTATMSQGTLAMGSLTGASTFTTKGAGNLIFNGSFNDTAKVTVDNPFMGIKGVFTTPTSGNLTLQSGVIGLNGSFTTAVGTGNARVSWGASGDTSAAGFAAYGGDLVVNLGGAKAMQTWGASTYVGFVQNNQTLLLSNVLSDGTVDFQNAINLNAGTRTVQVDNGSAKVDAKISGDLSGSAGSSLVKTGAGTLVLSGNNSYVGTTSVNAGKLFVTGTTTGQGAYNVANGASLGGAGGTIATANANVTLASGAFLDVSGNGAVTAGKLTMNLGTGVLDLSSAVTGNSGALLFTLDTVSTSDQVLLGLGTTMSVGAGLLDLNDFQFTLTGNFGAGTYVLFDSSSVSDLLAGGSLGTVLTKQQGGYLLTLSEGLDGSGNSALLLNVASIPEPATGALMLGGVLMLLVSIRRRNA